MTSLKNYFCNLFFRQASSRPQETFHTLSAVNPGFCTQHRNPLEVPDSVSRTVLTPQPFSVQVVLLLLTL